MSFSSCSRVASLTLVNSSVVPSKTPRGSASSADCEATICMLSYSAMVPLSLPAGAVWGWARSLESFVAGGAGAGGCTT